MITWLPIMIYGTTVALGLVLGWYFLSDKRPHQGLQMLHLLTGFGGLEVVMLVTSRYRANQELKDIAFIALILLGAAAFTGLVAAILAKPRNDALGTVLAAHALIGGSAFLALLTWTMTAL